MANWDEVPREIWRLIFQKLVTQNITHHIPFGGVCKSWRSIGLEHRSLRFPANIPGLMIPGGTTTATQTRRFLTSPVGKNINQPGHNLPVLWVPHESLCRGSHQGWLVMVHKDMSMYLHNPFSGRRIDLPPVTSLPRPPPGGNGISKWYVTKSILSASPSSTSDCFVLVFYGNSELAFCKVGDSTWKPIDGTMPPPQQRYLDAIFYKEQFYVVDHYGKTYVFDQLGNSSRPKLKELNLPTPHSDQYDSWGKWYLVESGGNLLHVMREVDLDGDLVGEIDDLVGEIDEEEEFEDGPLNDINEEDGGGIEGMYDHHDDDDGEENSGSDKFDDFDYDNHYLNAAQNFVNQTTQFQVFKLDLTSGGGSEPKWISDVEDLDGAALFLGCNQSFALPKTNLMGYAGDRIYYTDDHTTGHKLHIQSGHDMGVFNLKDSSFEPLCSTNSESTKPPAVWITPMPW